MADSVRLWGGCSDVNCSRLNVCFDMYVLASCALEAAIFNTQTLRQVRVTVLNIL